MNKDWLMRQMMRQYELVDRVRAYNPQANEDLLNRAYVYAMKAHGAQKRASGDPYFSHPLEVAAILTELHLDDATIVAAVLHDTIEDTETTREEIDRLFGPEIGALVEGLTKLKKLDLVSRRVVQAENFRKLLLAVAEDVRVLLVKLADRLHNMRTLHYVKEDKRARISEETLDIYAPLAGRMGMQSLRDELEDLAFGYLMPDARKAITERLQELEAKNAGLIERIEQELVERLKSKGIHSAVYGRMKQSYSIYRKMERKSVAFEQLSDIYGFRVVVDTIDDCYGALGVVHTAWPNVPTRFKDYISTPKQNDYRSLHTTVVGPGRQRVELQIRTQEMHEIAEYGIAAHTLYKDGRIEPNIALNEESSAYRWLRGTIEMLSKGSSPEEFLEHTKLELFHDQVFCFTPKGRLIALPRGATSVDFAYAVHTDVGDSAVGAKINGRIAPLFAPLRNGDEVEILRAKGQTPPAAWEALVVTGKARAAIRRATREAVLAQYAGLGRQIVTRAFERAGMVFNDEMLKAALPRLARTSIEEALAAVGRGEMFAGEIVKAVHPDFVEDSALMKAKSAHNTAEGAKTPAHQAIPVRGVGAGEALQFAPIGGAIPGDNIVGIMTKGEGVTIYPIQSTALTAFSDEPERWIDVRWDIEEDKGTYFSTQIIGEIRNEPGALGVICTTIGACNSNIDNIRMEAISPEFRQVTINLEVFGLKQLNVILTKLRALSVVSKIARVMG